MERSEQSGNPEQQKASDLEIALFLAQHIDNPCEVETYPGQIENMRSRYIKEARRILPTMVDQNAAKMMQEKIAEHEE